MPGGPGTGPRPDGGPVTKNGAHAMLLPPFPGSYSAVADTDRALARALAERLERETPEEVSASTRPAARAGRVFIDWLQNHPRRSTIAPYSLRALRDAPGVSAPVTWDEVAGGAPLRFTPEQVLERVERHGDLFAAALPAAR